MRVLFALAVLALLVSPAFATQTYNDATGETFTTAGGGILDIVSTEVSNTATDVSFKLTLNGDVVATDWGKYMIGIDSIAGGSTNSDGWARPITMSSGMDYWLGSWVDSGNGGEEWQYNGSGWTLLSATYNANPAGVSVTKSGNTVTYKTSLASLGLTPASSFLFDVYSSGGGGGDSAVDALGNNSQTIADWGNPYDSGANVKSAQLPEPAALGVLSVGALAILWRRRRARA